MDFDNIEVITNDSARPSKIGISRIDDDFIIRLDTNFRYNRFALTRKEAEALKSLLNRHL